MRHENQCKQEWKMSNAVTVVTWLRNSVSAAIKTCNT